jgi:hypothetical protein
MKILLHDLVMWMQALGDYPFEGNCSTSGCTPHNIEDDDDLDFDNWDDDNSDSSIAKVDCYCIFKFICEIFAMLICLVLVGMNEAASMIAGILLSNFYIFFISQHCAASSKPSPIEI